jgi:hypothetical protein
MLCIGNKESRVLILGLIPFVRKKNFLNKFLFFRQNVLNLHMINHKEDILNDLAGAIFIVFFFFIMSAFSGIPQKSANKPLQNLNVTEIPSGAVSAIIPNAGIFSSLEKSTVLIIAKKSISLFNEKFKISADTRKISRTIIFLRESEAYQNPPAYWRFYYHYFSKSSNELPVLS